MIRVWVRMAACYSGLEHSAPFSPRPGFGNHMSLFEYLDGDILRLGRPQQALPW
jgi:hypothetical protein